MYTYTYSYQTDSKHEPIGRVHARSLEAARKQIAVIKQLQEEQCDMLFVINQEESHANRFQSDIRE
jgi:hypothetical protein